jgi:hypothetical protein
MAKIGRSKQIEKRMIISKDKVLGPYKGRLTPFVVFTHLQIQTGDFR